MTDRDIILIGAGGHAAGVAEAATLAGWRIVAYVDQHRADWLDRLGSPQWFQTDADAITAFKAGKGPGVIGVVIGVGGIDPAGLALRTDLLERYRSAGFACPAILHPAAVVSDTASIAPGCIVLAGAIIQPFSQLADGTLINTRAVVEHHALVEAGGHVAPGATLLGAARLGRHALLGAHAVILPSAEVPADTVVPAGSVFKGARG